MCVVRFLLNFSTMDPAAVGRGGSLRSFLAGILPSNPCQIVAGLRGNGGITTIRGIALLLLRLACRPYNKLNIACKSLRITYLFVRFLNYLAEEIYK
jgi:hypothetical protein